MLTANYHTHTSRCHHAGNYPDSAYADAAVRGGIQILGFSDHTPWPYSTGYHDNTVRMEMEELPEYVQSIRKMGQEYEDRLKIYCGLECEFFPEYLEHIEKLHQEMDYLILGYHFLSSNEYEDAVYVGGIDNSKWFDAYEKGIQKALQTGWFRWLAHPDLVFNDYPVFDSAAEQLSRRICRIAGEMKIPLEYNLYGVVKQRRREPDGLGYPCNAFWKIAAEAGCQAIISCDAHTPSILEDNLLHVSAKEFLQKLGIQILPVLSGME